MISVRLPTARHFLIIVVSLWLAIAHLLFGQETPRAGATNDLPMLTTVAQIRQLSPEEAAKKYPVHLRALVIGRLMSTTCIVQDETGAIPIFREGATNLLWPGQIVELDGVSNPGLFAPKVTEHTLKVVGNGPLPKPVKFTAENLVLGKSRTDYGEVEGIVRSAEWDSRNNLMELQLAMGASRLQVFVFETSPSNSPALVDSTVRLVGVVTVRFNQQRQWLAARFNVTGFSNVFVVVPAPVDAFERPAQSVRNFAQAMAASPGTEFSSGHRLKIRGAVTHYSPGKALYIRDEEGGLEVQTRQQTTLKVGEIVDVVGFPAAGMYAPILEDALYRETGKSSGVEPKAATVKELLDGLYEAELVSLKARLISVGHHGSEDVLVLQAGDLTFTASLQIEGSGKSVNESLKPGSQVQLTGICQVREVTEHIVSDSIVFSPASFRLLLRSTHDVTVLRQPSWWTPGRLILALVAVTLTAFGAFAWVVLLRRRVRAQTDVILEKARREMILEERGRISREFHDTLEQELAGLAMQLDAVDYKFQQSPQNAVVSLGLARQMVRHCRMEARRSIWDLRSAALETGDLVSAMRETIKPMVEGTSVELRVDSQGEARRLPPTIENDLLRMGQEAAGNAFRHGQPRLIEVLLAYEPRVVRLVVSDDGCGFNPQNPKLVLSGRFGLAGMSERAAKLGGRLTVNSTPGTGARLEIVVPLAPGA